MGFLGFGDKKEPEQKQQQQAQQQTIWNTPDDQLAWNQRHWKRWHSQQPFITENGTVYNVTHKNYIDENLYTHFSCSDLDDLMEMKAPKFWHYFYKLYEKVKNLSKFLKTNIKTNNDYQQLQGRYEELKKRCEQQEAIIREFISKQADRNQPEPPQNHSSFVR